MARACGKHESEVKVQKPEGKRPLGRTRYKWDDIQKEYLNMMEE
jgi:hypothetical protein